MIYKLSLYYNLIIKQKIFKKRQSYSQFEEDKFIFNFFSNTKKGVYVDIGCFHPIKYNNTALLYNNGWTGINIDINQTSIDLFNIVRKNDKNICAAVSDESGFTEFYFDHKFSPINSLNKEFSDYSAKNFSKRKFTKKKVKKFIFHELIDEYKINLGNIDFLNIDVETHDFKVLKGINFNKYKPSLICIELYNKNLEIEEKKFIEFLSNYNYSLIKKIGPNGLFALNKWRGSSVG